MISIESLSMRYGAFTALDRISFQVKQGEILGLLGPNGAGKTTLMRLLTTYLYPSAGSASVAGYTIVNDAIEVRRVTGYLPETAPLYLNMRVDEYLAFVGYARGIYSEKLQERLGWLANVCGLKPVWKHTIHEISKGFRQRLGLAQALIHDPKVLILDEPTSGLDPLQIIGIRALIRGLAKDKTIIFSTHVLQEVEVLADRIVIIHEGRVVADGTRKELVKEGSSLEDAFIDVEDAKVVQDAKLEHVIDEWPKDRKFEVLACGTRALDRWGIQLRPCRLGLRQQREQADRRGGHGGQSECANDDAFHGCDSCAGMREGAG